MYGLFDLRNYDGTRLRILHVFDMLCREQVGCEASPTAAIIDSQSVLRLASIRIMTRKLCRRST